MSAHYLVFIEQAEQNEWIQNFNLLIIIIPGNLTLYSTITLMTPLKYCIFENTLENGAFGAYAPFSIIFSKVF